MLTNKLIIGSLAVVIIPYEKLKKIWSKCVVCISVRTEKINKNNENNENLKLILLARTPALLWKYNFKLSENILVKRKLSWNTRIVFKYSLRPSETVADANTVEIKLTAIIFFIESGLR